MKVLIHIPSYFSVLLDASGQEGSNDAKCFEPAGYNGWFKVLSMVKPEFPLSTVNN